MSLGEPKGTGYVEKRRRFSADPDDPAASIKYDAGKARHDLVPPHIVEQLAEVYTHGAQKYRDNNWTKGGPWGRYYAALQRHLLAYWSGEDTDPESELPHLSHVLWNVAALMHFAKFGIGEDDRLEKGRVKPSTNAQPCGQ